MRAELIPIDGGPTLLITKDITVLGRREYCDIQLDDPSLSKRHCVLVKTDGLLMVRDLATTNGTKVKGQMIRWAALLPNDRLTLGKVKFQVFLGPDQPLTPPEPKPPKPRRKSSKAKTAAAAPSASKPIRADRERDRDRDAERPAPVEHDDSRWFDRIHSDIADDEIIDLD